jgi:hypothetical protein
VNTDLKPATPEQRKQLIAKPFPPIGGGRLLPRSYPWAGTITNDNFYGIERQRRKPKGASAEDFVVTQYETTDFD